MVINSPNTIFHACKIAFVIANGIAIIVFMLFITFSVRRPLPITGLPFASFFSLCAHS